MHIYTIYILGRPPPPPVPFPQEIWKWRLSVVTILFVFVSSFFFSARNSYYSKRFYWIVSRPTDCWTGQTAFQLLLVNTCPKLKPILSIAPPNPVCRLLAMVCFVDYSNRYCIYPNRTLLVRVLYCYCTVRPQWRVSGQQYILNWDLRYDIAVKLTDLLNM